jgi:glycosyltransferase involved in cell wall biosynthesis
VTTERPVLICMAGDLWDGHPHSRHHLMRRFAAEWDVLFVEGVPMRAPALGRHLDWKQAAGRLAARPVVRQVEPGLYVLRPLPVPPAGRLGRALQMAVVRRNVERACRQLGLTGPRLLWFSLPNARALLGRLGERGAVFYYQDRYDAFSGVNAGRSRADVAALARMCDVTIATSDDLRAELATLGAKPVLVPHGVDVDHFSDDGASPPADIAHLERPLVGYVGLLDDYVSFEHLRATAAALDRGTLVLVGRANTSIDPVLDSPRVHWLGQRPYGTIPAYLQAFSCCLVPFARNRLTDGVNPIKLREYLAAGRPTVATAMPEILPYADVVEVADGAEEFARAVVRSLDPAVDDEQARRRRQARVASESWDTAAAQIAPLLERALSGRVAPRRVESVPKVER